MGLLAAITNKVHFIVKQLMHLLPKTYANVNELVRKKGLHITSFSVSYENIMSFFTIHISSDMDYLWHAAGLFSTPAEPSLN